jgi:hypothetical protein
MPKLAFAQDSGSDNRAGEATVLPMYTYLLSFQTIVAGKKRSEYTTTANIV